MPAKPIISILTTVYNRENLLKETIESVMNSDFEYWEYIIVDDNSEDRSFAIASEYAERDSRIKVYRNESTLGDYPNRNRAASYASGKYIKYLDSDDLIYKHSISIMVDAMESFPVAALGLTYNVINDTYPYPRIVDPEFSIREEFLGKSILGVGPSATIIRNDIFREFKGFSEKQFISDHDLWLKIASKYQVLKLQPSLIWWREHENQQIGLERKNEDILIQRLENNLSHLRGNKTQFSNQEYSRAEKKLLQNEARRYIKLGIKSRNPIITLRLYRKSPMKFFRLLTGFLPYYNP